MYKDEFAGQGGSYILDPKTGVRTRVEEPTVGRVRPVEAHQDHPLPAPPAEIAPPAPTKTGRAIKLTETPQEIL